MNKKLLKAVQKEWGLSEEATKSVLEDMEERVKEETSDEEEPETEEKEKTEEKKEEQPKEEKKADEKAEETAEEKPKEEKPKKSKEYEDILAELTEKIGSLEQKLEKKTQTFGAQPKNEGRGQEEKQYDYDAIMAKLRGQKR